MNDDLLALPIKNCKCGFPNPYMGEDEKFCPNDAVDIFEVTVQEEGTTSRGQQRIFTSYICQHHINIMSIMYDKKQLGQMIRQGDIRGEWLS